VEKDAWREVNCLSCGNCCKTMTPTFKDKDMKRISAHLNMTVQEFKDKWLYKQRGTGDWLNKSTPCQFLDLDTNMCSIYEVRPADCAGFPHFSKKKMTYYIHTHKQNLEYCPATYRMVEKMMEKLKQTVECVLVVGVFFLNSDFYILYKNTSSIRKYSGSLSGFSTIESISNCTCRYC